MKTQVINTKTLAVIFAFGVNEEGKTVCLKIYGHNPHLKVIIKNEIDETSHQVDSIIAAAGKACARYSNFYKKQSIEKYNVSVMNTLYDNKEVKVLTIYFKLHEFLTKISEEIVRNCDVKVYEYNKVFPILQFLVSYNLPSCGWIIFDAKECNSCETWCQIEYKMLIAPERIKQCEDQNVAPKLRVMSFDIETHSHDLKSFPDAKNQDDVVMQISAVFEDKRIILCIGDMDDDILCGEFAVEKKVYQNEYDLLLGFIDLICAEAPQIITGYNIYGFDWPYIYDRCTMHGLTSKLEKLSMLKYFKNNKCEVVNFSWSSSARHSQKIFYINSEGRINIDLQRFIAANFQFDNYKLSSVAENLLTGVTKDPVTPRDIFNAYHKYLTGADYKKELSVVAKYCVKDSEVVLQIFKKVQCLIDIMEMARLCNVSISDVNTRGQQIKIISLVYKTCFERNIIVETNRKLIDSEEDKYIGATVMEPVPGYYRNVIPFDFSSLYPSTIIAYNIDYTTLVKDENIPDDMCHVIEWSECSPLCKHETGEFLCVNIRYRFLREPQGIIPFLLHSLLTARANLKREMKTAPPDVATILDKRQLALKVCSNSAYGMMGTVEGWIPLREGATSITAKGRQNLKVAQNLIRERGLKVIYSDTDSVYVAYGPGEMDEIWAAAQKIEAELSDAFLKPITLLFEQVIYYKFILLQKKTYDYVKYDMKSYTMGSKGTVEVRRDKSKFTKKLYKHIKEMIFDDKSHKEIEKWLSDITIDLYQFKLPIENFILTTSFKNFSEYKITELPSDARARQKRLAKFRCLNEAQYPFMSLSVGPFIGYKMKLRDQPISPGTRIPYVFIRDYEKSTTTSFGAEDHEFFMLNRDTYKLDLLKYIERSVTSIDSILHVVFPQNCNEENGTYSKIYNIHCNYSKILDELYEFVTLERLSLIK